VNFKATIFLLQVVFNWADKIVETTDYPRLQLSGVSQIIQLPVSSV